MSDNSRQTFSLIRFRLVGGPSAPPPMTFPSLCGCCGIAADAACDVRTTSVGPPGRWRARVWTMSSFLPPLVTLSTFIYPNVIAAAVIVTAYRLLFTRPARSIALGAALLATTLVLTPRDGIALVALAQRKSRNDFARGGWLDRL